MCLSSFAIATNHNFRLTRAAATMDATASTGRRKVLRLKSLLAIPGGFTGPTSTKHEPIVCSTSIVPGDVILAVADLLAPSDVLNLSLAVRHDLLRRFLGMLTPGDSRQR